MIGFAFELQKLDRIHAKSWDVGLAGVATEAGVYRPRVVWLEWLTRIVLRGSDQTVRAITSEIARF